MVQILLSDALVKDRKMIHGRALTGLLGLALSVWLSGLSASQAMALSTTATHAAIVSGSTSPITGLAIGAGGLLDLGLVGGFPNATSLGHSFWSPTLGIGVTADGSGTTANNASRLTLNSSSNIFAQGQGGDSTKYQAAASFSNAAPVAVSPSGDHAFLFIDRELALDGGVEANGAPVATAFALTGKHRLDLLFADLNVRRSGTTFDCDGCVDATSTAPEPARLLLFGAALVGLGAVIRRRIRGLAKAI